MIAASSIITVIFLGLVVFGFYYGYISLVWTVASAGLLNSPSSQSEVVVISITFAMPVVLILWSLLAIVCTDPGFIHD